MKALENYIDRPASILTGKKNLEHLYTFRNFPVFMGCVDTPQAEDLVADMVWNICPETGVIQLGQLLPLEILYLNQHNDGVGQVWQDHYKAFATFLSRHNPTEILEIGGAHDHIARYYKSLGKRANWTTVEPNPEHINDPDIRVIEGWFDENFRIDAPVDTVIHSHVFEHTYDPSKFMENVGKFLKPDGMHVFSFPNMRPMLEKKFTNCLNFEHTVFLTEEITEYILAKSGFEIIEKEYYGNPHSIFYATRKVDHHQHANLENHYSSNKKLFMTYIDHHLSMIKELNAQINDTQNPVYLFGAHIFSQTLIQFGLNSDKVAGLLDNSEIKQGKRLYGTKLKVSSPKVLNKAGPVNVILKAGIYNDEIKKDILENINPEAVFW